MPGGALTANTQMMRDINCLHLYPEVIKAMQEVVELGGFGTSVTPVSQFYFQQAFTNVMSMQNGKDKWDKIFSDYGKMVLGYFGHTPADPDPRIVALAAEQLGLEPTKEDVHDINDNNPELGVDAASKKLGDAGLVINDENIFIVATCGDKGIAFLKGNKPLGIRYIEEAKPKTETAPAVAAAPAAAPGQPASYSVTVNGTTYDVHVAPGGATTVAPVAPSAAANAPAAGGTVEIKAPMPATVIKVLVEEGESVNSGDPVIVLEAMKMETEVKAHQSGKVVEIRAAQGASVASDEVLVVLSA